MNIIIDIMIIIHSLIFQFKLYYRCFGICKQTLFICEVAFLWGSSKKDNGTFFSLQGRDI